MVTENRQLDQSDACNVSCYTISVILVHGTGASKEGPPGQEQWWQPESRFARGLIDQLRGGYPEGIRYSIEAFKWSGDNSELKRREAGRELAAKVIDLEKSGTPYRLIGHSHGGSVIWHALVCAAFKGSSLQYLKSWITIGTPFLEFSPRNRSYLILSMASLLLFVMAIIPLLPITADLLLEPDPVFRDAPILATCAVALGLAGMLGIGLFLLLDVSRQVCLRLAEWRLRPSMTRSPKISKSWLGLAHDLDEPINGLGATLGRPPEIAPRVRRSTEVGPAGRLLGRRMSPYDSIVAPIIDAFVWDTGISRLQGRDIVGTIMTACKTSPPHFPFFWPSLPLEVLSDLSRNANKAASQTAAAFREELHKVSSGTEPAERIARAISWNEIIHTTYFANKGILELCAAFIRDKDYLETPTNKTNQKTSSSKWISTGPSKSNGRSKRHFEPLNLYIARAATCVALAAVLTFATLAGHQAWLLPYTNRFQIDLIHENMTKPQFTRLWESPTVGNLLVRLVALNGREKVFASLSNIKNPNTFIMAAELVAYGLAFYGDHAAVARLINEYSSVEGRQPEADVKLTLQTYALAGALAGGSSLRSGLIGDIHGARTTTDGAYVYGMASPSVDLLAATLLLKTGNLSDVDVLLDRMSIDCEQSLRWIENNKYTPPIQSTSAQLKACIDGQRKAPAPRDQQQSDSIPSYAGQKEPTEADPYEIAKSISLLFSRKDYTALTAIILSWNEDFAKRIVGAVPDDAWVEMIEGLKQAGELTAATRAESLYESMLRNGMDSVATSLADKLTRFEHFTEGMIKIGRKATLKADAVRFDLEARNEEDKFPASASESAATAGVIWLGLGNETAAKRSLRTAIESSRDMGELGFPFAMKIAEISSSFDREITRSAVGKAISLFEDAFRIDSIPDYSYSFTDVVRLYSKIGEYRLAREAAERVGQRLGENSLGHDVIDEGKPADPAAEKDSLSGSGILGCYIEILDAEIRRRSVSERGEIVDLIGQLPDPIAIYRTSFNRD